MFDSLTAFFQDENRRLIGAFMSGGMLIASMLRFIRSTGVRFETALALQEVKGASWTEYAPTLARRGFRVTVRNTGTLDSSITDMYLETKGIKGKFTLGTAAESLPVSVPTGEGRSFFTELPEIPDLPRGDRLLRVVLRDSSKGLHRSVWVPVRVAGDD